jgi:hypothetical protein
MATIGLKITVPKSWWSEESVLRELEKTLKKDTGKKIQKDFRTTVKGWSTKNKPKFPIQFRKTRNEMAVKVSTQDDIYRFVNDGTAPRLIVPKGSGKALRFKPGYRAGTRAGSISSSRPVRSGAFVTAAYVRHPGIEPRLFDETILKRTRLPFAVDVNIAIFKGMTD